jgi:hypothetical protein
MKVYALLPGMDIALFGVIIILIYLGTFHQKSGISFREYLDAEPI